MIGFQMLDKNGRVYISSGSFYLHCSKDQRLLDLEEKTFVSLEKIFPFEWEEAKNLDKPTLSRHGILHRYHFITGRYGTRNALFMIYPLSNIINSKFTILNSNGYEIDFLYKKDDNPPDIHICEISMPPKTQSNFGLQLFDTEGNVTFDAMSIILKPEAFCLGTADVSSIELDKYGIILDSQHFGQLKMGSTYLNYSSTQQFFSYTDGIFNAHRMFLLASYSTFYPQSKLHYNKNQNMLLCKIPWL